MFLPDGTVASGFFTKKEDASEGKEFIKNSDAATTLLKVLASQPPSPTTEVWGDLSNIAIERSHAHPETGWNITIPEQFVGFAFNGDGDLIGMFNWKE